MEGRRGPPFLFFPRVVFHSLSSPSAVLVAFFYSLQVPPWSWSPAPAWVPARWAARALAYLSRETAASVKLLACMVRKMRKCTALQSSGPNTQSSRV